MTKESQKLIQAAQYQKGQHLVIRQASTKNYDGKSLIPHQYLLGRVDKVETTMIDWKLELVYRMTFTQGEDSILIREKDLEVGQASYRIGDPVEVDGAKQGRIAQVSLLGGGEVYTVKDQRTYLTNLDISRLAYYHRLRLKESNSSQANNQLIQEAIQLNQTYPSVTIQFPKGRFAIGSQTPDSEYILLGSNTTLRGQETELVVEGTAYWFALATGPAAHDGVKNFRMSGLHFVASDLTLGNHFMIMANHGANWDIRNNRFTMVHKLSSHIFDLGGVQDSVFDSNHFIGYAPELTSATDADITSPHNIYAEAIQLDYSNQEHNWDGGLLLNIDPNYPVNNVDKQISNNITITNNHFLPYLNSEGQIVAYSASIGQHSSKVGRVTIANNYFNSLIAKRFTPIVGMEALFEAIHIDSDELNDIHSNLVE